MCAGMLWLVLVWALGPEPEQPIGCFTHRTESVFVGAPGAQCGRARLQWQTPSEATGFWGLLRLRGGRRTRALHAADKAGDDSVVDAAGAQEDAGSAIRRELMAKFGDMKVLSFSTLAPRPYQVMLCPKPLADHGRTAVQDIEVAGRQFLDGGPGAAYDMLSPGSDLSDTQVPEALATLSRMPSTLAACCCSARCSP
jgi:hypothetical protein